MALQGYEKIKTVGKGAFGTAVLYRKQATDTLVVIKEVNMMELTATERQMALNEVQVLSSLRHPNIIQYLGSTEAEGLLLIEMEYADAGTLAQLIARSSRMREREILSLFVQCVAAIEYMHRNNILHRDLKTANVFLTKDNSIKVGDFGISKIMSTKGQAQTVLGTPYYISPEMCEGKQYDTKSDVWALGCILYEMACLQKTFQGDNLPALVNKIMQGTFEPIPKVYSKGLRSLVSELLQKDPNLRPSASEIYERVRFLLDQSGKDSKPHLAQRQTRSVLYQVSGSGPSFSCVPVPLPPTLRVTQVAVSNTHYVVASDDGMVFTWGEGKRGQLGHPESTMWLQKPTLVRALVNTTTVSVAAGDGFSVFLSDSGTITTCGDGTFGCLGLAHWNSTTRPQQIERLMNEEVKQIACGDHHCLALTQNGEIFAWGRGNCGQLGTGFEVDYCEPTKILLSTTDPVKTIQCGPDCSAFVTESGIVHAWGSNRHNKLGLSHSFLQVLGFKNTIVEKYLKPQMVKTLKSWQIVKISLAANHSAALTDCGRVVTMGSNAEAQAGHNLQTPNVLTSLEDKIAVDVVGGPTYSVMTSDHNALYFWGTRYLGTASDSSASLSLLHSEVALWPEEMLTLYASPAQIQRGETVVLRGIATLWDTILVLVDTTVPLAQQAVEFDTMGPVPDWITAEFSQAEESNWD